MSSVRLSVRLSVTLVDQDHIGWKSWKLIARSVSQTPSLFSQKAIHLLPGKHGEIWRRLEMGWKKLACWSTKAAISLKRVKLEEKLLWRAYRKSQTLFRTAWVCEHQDWGSQTHPKTAIAIMSRTAKATNCKFG